MLSPLRVTTGPRQHIPQFWSGRGACVGTGAEKLPNAGSVDKGFFFFIVKIQVAVMQINSPELYA